MDSDDQGRVEVHGPISSILNILGHIRKTPCLLDILGALLPGFNLSGSSTPSSVVGVIPNRRPTPKLHNTSHDNQGHTIYQSM